jgi:putative hydrolase of the HAD superfamily
MKPNDSSRLTANMKVKVKAVIFDFGHVLTLPPRPENMAWLAEQCGLNREEFIRGWREMRLEVDRGTLPVPEFWARMARKGGRRLDPGLLAAIEERDLEAWTQPSPAMFAWAEELRRGGWATAILSNMPPVFLPWLEEHFPDVTRFRPAVFSGEVGMVKPEPGIYLRCLHLLGLPASETLFLDDLAVNVAAARSLGIHALEFHSVEVSGGRLNEHFELPALEPLGVQGG